MSTPLITLDALKETTQARTAKEDADKATLLTLFDTSKNGLVEKLHTWAGAGFPEGHVVLSAAIVVPASCIDGVKRTLFEYVAYLLGSSLNEQVVALQAQVGGVTFGWRVPAGQVQVVVSQAQ
jgi:hypothetical protein